MSEALDGEAREAQALRLGWAGCNAALVLGHLVAAAVILGLGPVDLERDPYGLVSLGVVLYALLWLVSMLWPVFWVGHLAVSWGAPRESLAVEAAHCALLGAFPALAGTVGILLGLGDEAWATLAQPGLAVAGPWSLLGSLWLLIAGLAFALRLRGPEARR
ncbi:MAG: hypothetical protein R3F62_17985 [Planctomycetota bacterium]